MTCLRDNPDGADLLIGYLEGTLAPEVRGALDQHAAACAECRGLLAVQQTLVDDQPEVSAGFDARLYARIQAESARPWSLRRLWRRLSWQPLIPLAAASAILAVTLWVRTPEPQSNVDRAEIEQLEQALEDMELLMPLGGASEAL